MSRISKYMVTAMVIGTVLLVAVVAASSKFLFRVIIAPASGVGDVINVVNLTDSWITFNGYTFEAKIPVLSLTYQGPKRMTYLRGGNNVTIEVPENFTMLYRFGYVNVTFPDRSVIIRWRGTPPSGVSKVNLTCIHAPIRTLRDALSEIINQASDEKLRGLVRTAPVGPEEHSISELEAGISKKFSEPGLYICLVYLNRSATIEGRSYHNVTILGLGLIYVMKYPLQITAPRTVVVGQYVPLTLTVITGGATLGGKYRYVYFITHESVFSRVDIIVKTTGKIPETKIYLVGRGGSKPIIEGQSRPRVLKILGKGLEKTKVEDFRDVLYAIFGSYAASIGYSGLTSETKYVEKPGLCTKGLMSGNYVLYGLLVDPSTKEILAVNWTIITLLVTAKMRPLPIPAPIVKPKPIIKHGVATYTIARYIVSVPGIFIGTLIDVEVTSADKVLTVRIPAFTMTLYKGVPTPVTKIAIKMINKTKAPTSKNVEIVSNKVYIIKTEPVNITFSNPVIIKFELPSSGNYYIAIWNATLGLWIPLPTIIVGKYAIAYTTRPGMFALVRLVPPVRPVVGKLEIEAPETVISGTPFVVKVKVLSTEGTPLAGKVVRLYLNGRYVAYAITDTSGTATFRLTIRSIGVFTLRAECDKKSATTTIVVRPVIV